MKNRTALSSRTRFEIFKRDGFRCVYCGATPVEAVLHVDHVKPVADGGDNDPTNLVTACQSCNGGKAAVPLSEKRLGPTRTPEEAADHAKQILAYLDAERGVVAAKVAVRDEIAEVWSNEVGYSALPAECAYLARCSSEFGSGNVVDAIRVAVSKIGPRTEYQARKCYRYFCGIIRRWRDTGEVSIGHSKKEAEKSAPLPGHCEMCGHAGSCDVCDLGPSELCKGCKPGGLVACMVLRETDGGAHESTNEVVLCEKCRAGETGVWTIDGEVSANVIRSRCGGRDCLSLRDPRDRFWEQVGFEDGRLSQAEVEWRAHHDQQQLGDGGGI